MELESRRKWSILLTATSFSGFSYLFIFHKSFFSWLTGWFNWCPTSADFLEQAERKILSNIKKPIQLSFIEIEGFNQMKENFNIRTLKIKNELHKNSIPLVLLHGFASGIGLWIMNLEKLSENRTVYAIDILGFGRSSRPQFSRDPELVEQQFIESIEKWRKASQLDRFILLGHSFGGYLAASYAIKYPDRVEHLILADPWGFPESDLTLKKIEIPLWVKIIGVLLKPFNPLAGLRAAGPWGPKLIEKIRGDIMRKFEGFVEDTSDVSNYIYHCNAQTPSGEAAFKAMTFQLQFSKRPMLKRITELNSEVSITFIYGSESWIDCYSGVQVSALRPESFVEVKIIQEAKHHLYADKASEFNKLVFTTCNKVEEGFYTFHSSKKSFTPRTSLNDEEKDREIKETFQFPAVV